VVGNCGTWGGQGHSYPFLFSSLGGHQNHAIGTLRSVDGAILQHLNVVDIVDVDDLQTAHLHSVEDIDRFGACIDGSDTSDNSTSPGTPLEGTSFSRFFTQP